MSDLHIRCMRSAASLVFTIRPAPRMLPPPVYSALYALQHRGQESCGIAVNDDGVIHGYQFRPGERRCSPGGAGFGGTANAHMATGHVRYATTGNRSRSNAQPMIVRHGRGTMALCHNGNLVNAMQLRNELENEGAIFHGTSDTEVICYLITRFRLKTGGIEGGHQPDHDAAGRRIQPGDHVFHQS